MLKKVCLFVLALTACMTAPAQPETITFDQVTRVFRLDGGNVSYAFGVNSRGELQQLYWGGRLGAIRCVFAGRSPCSEWASFDDSYTNTPQEYAGLGRWAVHRAGSEDHICRRQSRPGPALREPQDRRRHGFDVVLKDIERPIYVTLHYAIDPDTGILARSATIENRGKEPGNGGAGRGSGMGAAAPRITH